VKKSEAKCTTEMFPDKGWNFGGLKTTIGENDSRCSNDPNLHSGQLHTLPTQLQISTTLKILQ